MSHSCKCGKHWVASFEVGVCLPCLVAERDRYKALVMEIYEAAGGDWDEWFTEKSADWFDRVTKLVDKPESQLPPKVATLEGRECVCNQGIKCPLH